MTHQRRSRRQQPACARVYTHAAPYHVPHMGQGYGLYATPCQKLPLLLTPKVAHRYTFGCVLLRAKEFTQKRNGRAPQGNKGHQFSCALARASWQRGRPARRRNGANSALGLLTALKRPPRVLPPSRQPPVALLKGKGPCRAEVAPYQTLLDPPMLGSGVCTARLANAWLFAVPVPPF